MKQWVKIALWSFFGVVVVTLMVLTQKAQGEVVLAKPQIYIHVDGEAPFLTDKEVWDQLWHEGLVFEAQKRNQLDVGKIETFLENISQVRKVKVYSMIGTDWRIDVETRKPIARVYNKFGGTYYLDSDGKTMEISDVHVARSLIVTGNIPDRIESESVSEIINNDSLKSIRKLDDIYRISSYVCNDPLFRSLIGQIHLEKNGDFMLVPLVGDQKITFGSAYSDKEVAEKFKKLRIFYKQAMPFVGWETYKEISLKYKDQLVCKKKKING